MPLYLVRWVDLTISLVRALSEDDLVMRLDEVADPGAAKWWPYRGPIWIDLAPLVRFELPEDANPGALRVDAIPLEGLEHLDADGGPSQFLVGDEPGGEDTRLEMLDAIMARAFPALSAALSAYPDPGEGEDESEAIAAFVAGVERAVRAELVELVQHRWRAAQISDPALRAAGVTIELPSLRRRRPRDASSEKSERDRLVRADELHALEHEGTNPLELARALARRLARAREALRRIVHARQGRSTAEHLVERLRGIALRAHEDDDETDLNMADELGRGLARFTYEHGPSVADDVEDHVPWPEDVVEDDLGAWWRVGQADEDGLVELELVRKPPPVALTRLAARAVPVSDEEIAAELGEHEVDDG